MPRDLPTVQQEGLEDALRTPAPQNRPWKVEVYRTPPPGYYYPPSESGRRFGIPWPTGFSGGGYLVRDAAGDVVFASAWRRDCLEYVDRLSLPAIGARVRLLHDVDRYPHFIADAGMEGSVVDYSDGVFSVRMDDHLEGAEDWQNEIVWSVRDGADPMRDLEVIS